MTNPIPGGHFLMSRMIYLSAIWKKPPQYLRLFLWFIGKAVFQDGYTFKGHILKRGELITTYGEIAGALSYCFNRAIITPSVKEIRIMLSWLQSEGMILLKPLIDGTSANKGRPIELTRAYIGLSITVINYDTYQNIESYKGRNKGRPFFEQGQLEKEGRERMNKPFSSDSIEIRLSELLFEKILFRNPNHKKPNIQTWAKDIDLMIRLDKRTPEDIRRVIEWCQADTFWQSNILSTAKLRKQFDHLQAKMRSEGRRDNIGSAPQSSGPDAFSCPRCERRIVVQSDLTKGGCVYCEAEFKEARV